MKHLIYIALLCAGCASYMPQREYAVQEFRLVLAPPEYIQDMYDVASGYSGRKVLGYCDMEKRVLYVPYSKWNSTQPDFTILGHEVWHLNELGGLWHD